MNHACDPSSCHTLPPERNNQLTLRKRIDHIRAKPLERTRHPLRPYDTDEHRQHLPFPQLPE